MSNIIRTIATLAILAILAPRADAQPSNSNWRQQGGLVWHIGGDLDVEAGGEVNVKSGGALDIESGATVTNAGTTTNSGDQTNSGTVTNNSTTTANGVLELKSRQTGLVLWTTTYDPINDGAFVVSGLDFEDANYTVTLQPTSNITPIALTIIDRDSFSVLLEAAPTEDVSQRFLAVPNDDDL